MSNGMSRAAFLVFALAGAACSDDGGTNIGTGGTGGSGGTTSAGSGGNGGTGATGGNGNGGAGGNATGGTAGVTTGGTAGVTTGGTAGVTTGGTAGVATGGTAGVATGGTAGTGGTTTSEIAECCAPGSRNISGLCFPEGIVCGSMFCGNRPHTKTECGAGACSYVCRDGYGDCDGRADNGCETKLVDPAHCGSCGTSCQPGDLCSEGAGCVAACTPPETQCGDSCVNTNSSALACNGCGGCSAPDHASPVCGLSGCDFVCDDGYDRCGPECVDTQIDPNSCGACGQNCAALPGGLARCVAGQCEQLCAPGFALCNGFCLDPRTDSSACGGCNQPCNGVCVGGICESSFDPVVVAGATGDGLMYDAGNLFWLDGQKIMMAAATGGTAITLASGQVAVGSLYPHGNYVYYYTSDSIRRVALTGSAPELLSATSSPSLLAVGDFGLFWTESAGGTVFKTPLSGGTKSAFYTAPEGKIAHLELSPDGRKLFVLASPSGSRDLLRVVDAQSATTQDFRDLSATTTSIATGERSLFVGTNSTRQVHSYDPVTGQLRHLKVHDGTPEVGETADDWVYYRVPDVFSAGYSFARLHACGYYTNLNSTTSYVSVPAVGPDYYYYIDTSGVVRRPR